MYIYFSCLFKNNLSVKNSFKANFKGNLETYTVHSVGILGIVFTFV